MRLTTPEELAEAFGLDDVEELHRLRRANRWPCVKMGRWKVRFTDEQVAEILAIQAVASPKSSVRSKSANTGQTSRSAARSI